MRHGIRSWIGLAAVTALAVGAPVIGLGIAASAAGAGTSCAAGPLTVTTSVDSTAAGTLRTALTGASGVASAQTICIDTTLVVSPIVLGSDLPTLAGTTGELTILGNDVIINGNGHAIIHDISSEELKVDAVSLTAGHNAYGGAIWQGDFAGGPGSVVLTNSAIFGNTSDDLGGGIFVGGAGFLAMTNSTVADNQADNAGGGVEADGGVTLVDSTVSGNAAASDAGGIFSESVTVTNSTVANNTATSGAGGGIFAEGDLSLVYATVVGNTASGPGGANIDGGSDTDFSSFGSVVSSPQGGGPNCADLTSTTSDGWNWDDDGTCGFGAGTGDRSDAGNPQLGALDNNGGSTSTMLPQTGSALIDAIPPASCAAGDDITTDQIGTPRPLGPGCDIGSVEVRIPTAGTTPTTPAPPAAAPLELAPRFTG